MSKSVLVIDTPENCYDCPFGTAYCGELEYVGYCELAGCLDYDVILMTEEHYDCESKELKKYREIGTIEECQVAMEKFIEEAQLHEALRVLDERM